MLETRIRKKELINKIMSPFEASNFIKPEMIIATSGFTPAGYPKVIPLELAKRARAGENLNLTIITGASVGEEIDGELTSSGAIKKRFPYQTNTLLRDEINKGTIIFQDYHLSKVPEMINRGIFGEIDFAIIEAVAISEKGEIIPTTSVGISPQAIEKARHVIIEINVSQPKGLEGMHDIYFQEEKNLTKSIPINSPNEKIGTKGIKCDLNKVVAIVESNIPDKGRNILYEDERSKFIAKHLLDFFKKEVKEGNLPANLLPIQSGVGKVANSVLKGFKDSDFKNLVFFTEVIQDSIIDLIDAGKVDSVSGAALTLSKDIQKKVLDNIHNYSNFCLLRPLELSNSPALTKQFQVISINTAIEIDIYGHVNSTNLMGSKMMNGIGGSGDFTRNAYLSIFTTYSTAKDNNISSIVPMVSHVDHTEHDVQIIVTEYGLADLRGLAPRERAKCIIQNCSHPLYRDQLLDYFERAEKQSGGHEPHLLREALSWHANFLETGTMLKNEKPEIRVYA